MGVEKRVNRTSPGQAGNGFQQRFGSFCGSAINEQYALRVDLHENIGFSGLSQYEQIVAQFQRACVRWGLRERLISQARQRHTNDPDSSRFDESPSIPTQFHNLRKS